MNNLLRPCLAGCLAALLVASPAGAIELFATDSGHDQPVPAVEYYNAEHDQFFLTTLREEVDAIDAGQRGGWARVAIGPAFLAFNVPVRARMVEASRADAKPVCRFYVPPAAHFLTISAEECELVALRYPGYVLETRAAFYAWQPDLSGGCPQLFARIGGFKYQPVYRLWDKHRHGADHRYTASKVERDALVGQGWISEGYGEDGVAMCVPAWG